MSSQHNSHNNYLQNPITITYEDSNNSSSPSKEFQTIDELLSYHESKRALIQEQFQSEQRGFAEELDELANKIEIGLRNEGSLSSELERLKTASQAIHKKLYDSIREQFNLFSQNSQ